METWSHDGTAQQSVIDSVVRAPAEGMLEGYVLTGRLLLRLLTNHSFSV